MSKITQEKLLAGIIFGDNDNEEYIYLPGGEVGSEAPLCVLERGGSREDLERRPIYKKLMEAGVFGKIVYIKYNGKNRVYTAEEA